MNVDQYELDKLDYKENQCAEPMAAWGGKWTEQKLDAFEKYVRAYLTIMNKYRDQYNWKLIYFDAFAGSGSRGFIDAESQENPSLFDDTELAISESEYNVYVGAAERVLKIDIRGFDFYYFNEKDSSARNELEEKLKRYQNPSVRYEYRSNDANEEIKKLANALISNKKYKALALLDPFGMQLNWESIELLKNCGVDIWILVPTGVIINRLLDRKGKLIFSDKLQKFFGLTEQEIKEYFYEDRKEQTLFGEEINCHKLPDTVHRIAELYVDRLKGIFKYVTEKPLVLNNTRDVPIFHFVFASNNENARKIANDIVGVKQGKK